MKRTRGPVQLCTVIQSDSTPVPEARDALVELFRTHSHLMTRAAFVMEGQGFAAAAQRSIAAAIIFATGRRQSMLVTGDYVEAVRFLDEQSGREAHGTSAARAIALLSESER